MAKTNIRLSDELYERIKRLAEYEHRSVNSQIVVMLELAANNRRRLMAEREKKLTEERD